MKGTKCRADSRAAKDRQGEGKINSFPCRLKESDPNGKEEQKSTTDQS